MNIKKHKQKIRQFCGLNNYVSKISLLGSQDKQIPSLYYMCLFTLVLYNFSMYNSKNSGLVETFDVEDAHHSKNSLADQMKDNFIFKFIFSKPIISGTLVVLALILIFMTSSSGNDESSVQFQKWKAQYAPNSKFTPEENTYRTQIFKNNQQTISKHNAQNDVSYKMGINQFAILTNQQFQNTYLMSNFAQNYGLADTESITNGMKKSDILVESSPDSNSKAFLVGAVGDIDWQSRNKITSVKNQGICGSCYSFATVGMIENRFLRVSNQVTDLSQQQLVDCTVGYGNLGCKGGNILNSLYYVLSNIGTTATKVGIASQAIYPYRGNYGGCSYLGGSYKISGGYYYTGCSNIIYGLQTSAVALYVDATNWQLYFSGIFTGCSLAVTINHAVLLVGLSNGVWRIKNSWGTTWGESGYIRLPAGNSCGICIYSGFTTY